MCVCLCCASTNGPVLEGCRVYCTASVVPPKAHMKGIVTAAGGTWVSSTPKTAADGLLFVSCDADLKKKAVAKLVAKLVRGLLPVQCRAVVDEGLGGPWTGCQGVQQRGCADERAAATNGERLGRGCAAARCRWWCWWRWATRSTRAAIKRKHNARGRMQRVVIVCCTRWMQRL